MTMKKIKLFDYQEDMVKRVQEAFRHHGNKHHGKNTDNQTLKGKRVKR